MTTQVCRQNLSPKDSSRVVPSVDERYPRQVADAVAYVGRMVRPFEVPKTYASLCFLFSQCSVRLACGKLCACEKSLLCDHRLLVEIR